MAIAKALDIDPRTAGKLVKEETLRRRAERGVTDPAQAALDHYDAIIRAG